MLHRFGALRGVSWAIAQEQPVEVILGEVIVPGHHCDTEPQLVYQVPGTAGTGNWEKGSAALSCGSSDLQYPQSR